MIVDNGKSIIIEKCFVGNSNPTLYDMNDINRENPKTATSTYVDAMYKYKTEWNDDTESGTFMLIGVGDAEPTVNDITLDNMIVEGNNINNKLRLTAMSAVVSDIGEATYFGLFTNNSGNDVSFKEIGLFVRIIGATTETTGTYMIARNVKDNESIVKNGESVCVCVKINFQQRAVSVE